MADFRSEIYEYLEKVKDTIDRVDLRALSAAMNALLDANARGATVYVMGNGGSSATASHMVCDFNKGISAYAPKKFRFVCLSDNQPTFSAIANDIGYDDVFYEQLRGVLAPDDVVLAISGSGSSMNVVKAAEYAKSVGARVVSMTGYDGGKLKELSDFNMHADIMDMQVSEDLHMIFDHMMMRVLCDYFQGESGGGSGC